MRYIARPWLLVLLGSLVECERLHAEAGADKIDGAIDKLTNKYSIAIVVSRPQFPVKTYHGEINGTEGSAKNVASFLPILSAEWNLYPADLVKKAGLRRIVLCEELSFAGQARTAIPDFEHRDLYLDVGRGRHSELYTRKVIHHEFFHVLDLRNGTLYSDERWSRLLPKGAKYGTGGKNAQGDASGSLLNPGLTGFLNRYSATGVEEDKAEIFACMVVVGSTVQERAHTDAIIRAKSRRMREFLKSFCSEVDDSFWEAAAKVERLKK
jgi:hypothetical protein